MTSDYFILIRERLQSSEDPRFNQVPPIEQEEPNLELIPSMENLFPALTAEQQKEYENFVNDLFA